MEDNKRHLQYKFTLHKDRLTNKEQFLLTMYLYADWSIGKIAKFAHSQAPIVKEKMKRAVDKL